MRPNGITSFSGEKRLSAGHQGRTISKAFLFSVTGCLYAALIRSTGLMVSPRLASAIARLMSLNS
jgi:hypothetical protein